MLDIKHKVTVYILVYNNEDGMEKTVESVLLQDMDDMQIIISDDGSTKYDTSLLKKYQDRLKERFQDVELLLNPENVGTVKHINKVLSCSTGKYLIPLSSGDAFATGNVVSSAVGILEKTGRLILASRYIDMYLNGRSKVRPNLVTGLRLKFMPKQLMNYMIRKRNLISGCAVVYSRDLFEQYGFFDEKYHLVEDYPYYIKLLGQGLKFGWMGKPITIHEIGGVSTGKVHPSIYKDIDLMREELYQHKEDYDRKTRAFLEACHEEKKD